MVGNELGEAIDAIQVLMDEADESFNMNQALGNFYLQKAKIESILVLAKVIQGLPFLMASYKWYKILYALMQDFVMRFINL